MCPTPNWYADQARFRKYIEEVCLTETCKQCTHYQSLDANRVPNAQALDMIIKAIKDNHLYRNRYREDNPSMRDSNG